MECLIGLVGDGYCLIAADTTAVQSILVMKDDQDKTVQVGDHQLIALSGEGGDCDMFGGYIKANLKLYSLRNGVKLSTHAAANYARGELATALRSRGAYQTNLLIAGWDEGAGPSLYFLDYLACLHKQNTAAHGYGAFFSLSLMDKHWTPGMSEEEGVALLKRCIDEVKHRLVVAPNAFDIKIIDKDGVRKVCRYEGKDEIATGA